MQQMRRLRALRRAAPWLLALAVASTASAQETGLPFSDDFENGLSRWPNSGLQTSTVRATSPTHSVAGNAVSGGTDSSWLLHYWGDTNTESPGSLPCGADCPGGATPEVTFGFRFYLDADPSLADAPYGGYELHRKIAILGSFVDWNAGFGSNQSNSAYYFSLPLGNFGGGRGLDLAFNSWRRHNNAGQQIADVVDSAVAYDAIFPRQWYDVRVRARLNTPGSADGVLQLWLDGNLVIDRQDMNFRGGYTQQTWNYLMLLDNGDGPSPGTVRYFWDDVEITEGAAGGGGGGGGGEPTTPPDPPILLDVR